MTVRNSNINAMTNHERGATMIDEINTKEIAKELIAFKEKRELVDPLCDQCGMIEGVYIEVLEEVEDISFVCPRCIARRYLEEKK